MSLLSERLADHARERPSGTGLRTAHGDWTWIDMARAAERVRDELSGLGVAPGSVVALCTGDGPEFMPALLGIDLLGAVPAVLDPEDPRLVEAVLESIRPAAVVTAESVSLPGREAQAGPGALDIACILYTSGTTAQPKGIVWSKPRLRAKLDLLPTPPLDVKPEPCFGLVLPFSYAGGFFSALRSLWWGVPLAIIDTPVAVVPALEAMQGLGVTFFSCMPTYVELLLRAGMQAPAGLRSVRVSGAPIAAETLLAFADLFSSVRIVKSYGLAEVGAVSRLSPEDLRKKSGTSGLVLPGQRVDILDEEGRALPPGKTGEIVVCLEQFTPSDGYYKPDGIQADSFRDGTLKTGDLGYLDADGFLVITGRTAEFIKVAGLGVSAPAIESTLRAMPGAPSLAVVGVSHRRYGEVPVVVYEPTVDADALRSHARRTLRAAQIPRWYLPRRTLPRSAAGKLLRSKLQEEASRWTGAWSDTVAHAGRLWPSGRLEGQSSAGDVMVLDGLPESLGEALQAASPKPGARALAFVLAGPEVAPVGWATLQDGLDPDTEGIRILGGPFLLADFQNRGLQAPAVRHLVELAWRLPGPGPRAFVAVSHDRDVAREFLAAGFSSLTGQTHVLVARPGPRPGMLESVTGDLEAVVAAVAADIG